MKKLLTLLFLGIFLISFASALEFDNGIEYRNNDLTVDFENGYFFGMGSWFGLNEKIGQATLKSHQSVDQVLEFGYGTEAVVMFYNFQDWEIYEDGLGEVIFIDENTGEEIEKDYYFVKQVLKDFEVANSEGECNILKNGTQECTYGVHLESFPVWEILNGKDIPKGNTTIGIKTYINKGDYIDAIWTIAGKKLSKHALWTAADGQVAYWKLDELSGTLVDVQSNINFTAVGSPLFGEPGIINTGVGMDEGFQGFQNTTSSNLTGIDFGLTGDYTFNIWINFTGQQGSTPSIFNTNNQTQPLWQLIGGSSGNSDNNISWATGTFQLRSTADLSFNEFHMITGVRNNSGADYYLFIDGVLNNSALGESPHNASAALMSLGNAYISIGQNYTLDEFGIWNQSFDGARIAELYNSGNACPFGSDPNCQVGATINLDSPENNANFTLTTIIVMNATIFDITNITNVTLYLDGIGNETNLTSGLNNTVWTFTKNTGQGTFFWTIEACNFNNTCTNASQRTFNVDTLSPIIEILAPLTTVSFHVLNTNLSVNWSINDSNLDTCILEYEGINRTLNCIDNQTTINITNILNRNITIYANDTLGRVSSSSRSWNYTIFLLNQTFKENITEGSTQDISALLQLQDGETISAAILNYNGSLSAGTTSISGDNILILESGLVTPSVDADTNITFQWSIVLSGGETINLSAQNQTILNLAADNCAIFTNKILNLSMVDEQTQTNISIGTILEIALNIFSLDRTTEVVNFSGQFESINPVEVCLNINLSEGTSYSLDSIIRYTATGYANEYYNIVDFTLDNNSGTQNIILFDLNITDSTDFQLTFTGEDFLPVENALVSVERQYIAENTFKTVELPKTDSNGQTILHLVRNEVIYNIIVIKDGEVLGNFQNVIAFCQDFTIGSCSLPLNALSNTSLVFEYDDEIGLLFQENTQYNETTRIASFSFASTDGTTKVVNMRIERRDVFGNRSICNNTVVSSSGSVSCQIASGIEDTTLISIVSVDGEDKINSEIIIDSTAYGQNGYAIFFLFSIAMLLMFSGSKTWTLVGISLNYIIGVSLGFIVGGIAGVGSTGIFLLIISMVGIWQLNKERKQ